MSAEQDSPTSPTVIHSETLDFNADCAEFCPVPGLTHLLALGTYQLLEEQQQRVGRCYLCTLQREVADGAPSGSTLASSLDMPGIFDLKWRPPGGDGAPKALLGAALADGTVRVLEVVTEDSDGAAVAPVLRQQNKVAACRDGMSLSLDWQARSSATETRIVSSSSSGTVSVLQVTGAGLALVSEWKAHGLEAWCAAFDRTDGHLIFSGADDCYFKAYDTRSDPATPVFADRRTHTAGVCTVSAHPVHNQIVATGCYDEHIRLWDMRNMSKPIVIAQVNTGGGNWRLRWHPHDEHLLLAACMYNGFGVLRADAGFQQLGVLAMYQSPNKHIAYGADWWQEPWTEAEGPNKAAQRHQALAATCSFYDRLHTLVWLPVMA